MTQAHWAKALQGRRIHILGIAGTLMGAFGVFLKRQGLAVTGSDQNIYPPMSHVLKDAGLDVFSPYSPANIEAARPDLVIVGNVIRKSNPEMEEVQRRGLEFQSLPATLEKWILPQKHSLVVAGTHGKTTTSSMLAWVLECLGENPSFFVGGVLQNFSDSFRITDSKYMVLEGDEYDTAFFDKVPKFTHYLPTDVILTSVEYDHADIYPDMASVVAAFQTLAKITPAEGLFVVCAESETPLRVASSSTARTVTYGFGENVDSRAVDVQTSANGASFTWVVGDEHRKVSLRVPGNHNVLNALAVLTLAHARHWDVAKCVEAIGSYRGVKRRQEVFGAAAGVTLIDDFAHHPTAVRETIAAIRAKYPNHRLVACFEPRSATSRRKVFQQSYAESFDSADLVYISKPYDQTQIDPTQQFSTEELLASLKERGKRGKILSTQPGGIKDLSGDLKTGDVVLVMSNGGFDGLLPKLLALLQTKGA
jgi:UDP-N-acetylmuramate: L-alanyl-gamma-D-glutamyl-meso-diaminopimelate ligase